jgi:hypothetical protein
MPMMIQPVYQAPTRVYPAEYAPAGWANQSVGWSAPAQAAPASAIAVSPRAPSSRPIIRAKGPDEPLSSQQPPGTGSAVPLTIPPPEQLGISLPSVPKTNAPNWVEELERLAAISYRLDKLAEGGCRFTCLLPTSHPGFNHRVEAEAATETEAVRLVLDKAREWAADK